MVQTEGPDLGTLEAIFQTTVKAGVSKMSQRETTDPTGHLEVGQSPKENLPKLLEMARQAYERKQTKDCLDLTRAILLIEPNNPVANWMRSALQTELHQDLESARAFLRQARSKETAEEPTSEPSQTETLAPAADQPLQEIIAAVATGPPIPVRARRRGRLVVPAILVLVLGLGLAVAALPRFKTKPQSVQAPKTIQEVKVPAPNPLLPPERSAGVALTAAAIPTPVPASAADPALVAERPSPRLPAPRAVAVPATGTLAISSPTAVDIYRNDAYVGSAPVSLDLPAGTQTLEYRHGNLRKQVTHIINGNETSRAMITFDVSLQVNSKPWAEVFLDGVEKKSLGQTPLSGVRVPIGSVLVFENPQFQTKRYRVTGNETGIQIVFP
jgi:hypothetical protein